METYWAPEEKIYVHKDKKRKLYGEMILIFPEDDYVIEDFILIKTSEVKEYFENLD